MAELSTNVSQKGFSCAEPRHSGSQCGSPQDSKPLFGPRTFCDGAECPKFVRTLLAKRPEHGRRLDTQKLKVLNNVWVLPAILTDRRRFVISGFFEAGERPQQRGKNLIFVLVAKAFLVNCQTVWEGDCVKFYDASSYSALRVWLDDAGGQLISDRQVGVVTDAIAFTDRFYRQRITESNSGSLVVENALRGSGNVQFKIYWTALAPSPAGIMITPLDRKRDGHYVLHVDSTSWLTTASLSPY